MEVLGETTGYIHPFFHAAPWESWGQGVSNGRPLAGRRWDFDSRVSRPFFHTTLSVTGDREQRPRHSRTTSGHGERRPEYVRDAREIEYL